MILKAQGITFKYFENSPGNILENVDFELPEHKITILMGKSGSGKSTLAYILAGLYPENGGFLINGQVLWGDVNIHSLTADKRVAYISMMFQNPDLQFCMNNLENEISFCLENIGIKENERPPLIKEAAEYAKASHLFGKNFSLMSGGEKQKCALACILALKSKCIILDEAFANVDEKTAKEIIAAIKKLGLTVLAIDHNLDLWEGAYDNIVSLGGISFKPLDTAPQLHITGAPVIKTKALIVNSIKYPDMVFEKGSLTAVTGKSGVGKTTFFKTLMKQYKYTGQIEFLGENFAKLKKRYIFSKCGIVFQNPANQFLALTVFEEVFFSVNHWHKGSTEEKNQKTTELLEIFGLNKYKKYSPYLLSQGQQRRLAVLTMIAGGQDIILLDEPTYGQDYENICAIMNLLIEKAKMGLTVIYSTHNGRLANNFSHKIINLEDYFYD